MKQPCLLVVAAHPDDEVLLCGGTMARLAREGWRVESLIVGDVSTSREAMGEAEVRAHRERVAAEMDAARRALGVHGIRQLRFADNRMDTVALLDLVKAIEAVVEELVPELVITHQVGDLNVDHRLVHEAVLTATRPLPGSPVRQVLAGEVLSSSEWRYPTRFSPNVFREMGAFLEAKCAALEAYGSEIRSWPHPRSREGIVHLARTRGMACGLEAAEAFELVRLVD